MQLAENLIYLMAVHNVSGKELADKVGMKATAISSYRSGTLPPLDKASKIARFFNVSLEDLVNKNLKEEGIDYKMDNSKLADTELLDMLKRYERLLQELEQDKSVTEDDYNKLWQTVRRHAPKLAKQIEDELKGNTRG